MGLLIRLLELKNDFVKLLREYNNEAEMIQKEEGSFDNIFFQQYGWIGSTINILSIGIRHVISKFRCRGLSGSSNGLNNIDQDKVGRNFASILINPLN